MAISIQQYAQALYEAIEENPKKEDSIIKAFVEQIHQSGDMGKMKAIMSTFERLYNKHTDSKDVVVLSRAKLDKKAKTEVEKMLKTYIKGEANIEYKEDTSITGGIKIIADSKEIDMTVNGMLSQFYSKNNS